MEQKITVVPSEDQVKRLREAAHDTWEAIAGDIFDSMAECGDNRSSISATEVEELVADADHIETLGGLNKVEIDLWRKLTYKQQHAILKSAFSGYKEWGL